MRRYSSSFRRLACALTTAHMLVLAVAPYLETGFPVGTAKSVTVANAASNEVATREHDANSCPACVLLNAHASRVNNVIAGAAAREVEAREFVTPTAAPQNEPQPGFFSRAPPTID